MSTTRIQSQRAMTLLEVMVAASVVLVGVVGFIQALTIGSTLQEASRNQTVAGQILQHEISRLRLLSWSQISSEPSPQSMNPTEEFSEIAAGFTGTRTFTTVEDGLRRVTLSVTWTSKVSGRSFTRTTELYLGKYGLHGIY